MIYRKEGEMLLIRMEDGEEFFPTLQRILSKAKVKFGVILSCVGQLKDVEIAYYSKAKKKYLKKRMKGPFEVLSLSGNISFFGKERVIHVHATLGNKKFACLGGHLNEAKVNCTLELFILTGRRTVKRKVDKKTGLKLLEF